MTYAFPIFPSFLHTHTHLQPRSTGRVLEYETLAAFGEQHSFDYLAGAVGSAHVYVHNAQTSGLSQNSLLRCYDPIPFKGIGRSPMVDLENGGTRGNRER